MAQNIENIGYSSPDALPLSVEVPFVDRILESLRFDESVQIAGILKTINVEGDDFWPIVTYTISVAPVKPTLEHNDYLNFTLNLLHGSRATSVDLPEDAKGFNRATLGYFVFNENIGGKSTKSSNKIVFSSDVADVQEALHEAGYNNEEGDKDVYIRENEEEGAELTRQVLVRVFPHIEMALESHTDLSRFEDAKHGLVEYNYSPYVLNPDLLPEDKLSELKRRDKMAGRRKWAGNIIDLLR